MSNLAYLLNLSPQARKIVEHIEKAGSISAREAMSDYGITSASLARRICDIEAEGFIVKREQREHPIHGRKYTRYSIVNDNLAKPEPAITGTRAETLIVDDIEPLKVGDRVRIAASYECKKSVGKEGVIIEIDEDSAPWPYVVDMDGEEYTWLLDDTEIERVAVEG